MATLKDYRDERLKKLAKLHELGVDPYPSKSQRTVEIGEIIKDAEGGKNGLSVSVVGRIKSIRSFGKLAFIVIKDFTGEIQLFLKAGDVKPFDEKTQNLGMENINLLDTGDFIAATGNVGKTKTGEISVFVETLRILTKSLRPLPGRDGFTNKEERYRRRYVDMNVNEEVRACMVRRSKFWQATRDFMNARGFIEINTPILEHTTGGADAVPFVTHMDALDQDFYLRISHELPLKRLLGGGFEKVYDIGARFRNEGVDDEHLPEHIAFESYAAYENYEDGMELYEAMIKYVCEQTWGTLQFKVGEFEIDLDKKWERVKYADIMQEKFGVDVFNPNKKQLRNVLKEHNVELSGVVETPRLLDNVWKLIRKTSGGPFWLIHEPLEISPLAKQEPSDPRVTQRFHPVIAGTELGNGYSELNDPLDQLRRFEEQQAMRDKGDGEAQMLDMDFVEMLEYGMPPACGWGSSERNFWVFEGVTAREGVPFPLMKKI
ncbi:MAG: lysine--tRNA ligase [Candidatus Nomurabacteria bacterium]|jgi:lysyl-tRNA synthetase class 2|nr:lysine--tRNA ligase [Candidatus Nomurabacteria bacterium]